MSRQKVRQTKYVKRESISEAIQQGNNMFESISILPQKLPVISTLSITNKLQQSKLHENPSTLPDIPKIEFSRLKTEPNGSMMRSKIEKTSKLFPSYALSIHKERKVLSNFENYKRMWRKNQQTFQQIRLFKEQNQPKQRLIQQHASQFWKMSLRNNNKKLLKHIEGIPFQQNQIIRNLQTIRGTGFLQSQVPKLTGTEFNGFAIKAKQITECTQNSTLDIFDDTLKRQFPKYTVEQTLKSNWKDKHLSRIYQY